MAIITQQITDTTRTAQGTTAAFGDDTDYSSAWDVSFLEKISVGYNSTLVNRSGMFFTFSLAGYRQKQKIVSAVLDLKPYATKTLGGTAVEVAIAYLFSLTSSNPAFGATSVMPVVGTLAWTGPQDGWTKDVRNANSRVDITALVQAAINSASFVPGTAEYLNVRVIDPDLSVNGISEVWAGDVYSTPKDGPLLTIDDGMPVTLDYSPFSKMQLSNRNWISFE